MNKLISLLSNVFVYILVFLQIEDGLKIVELCLAIVATVISIVFSIINWYKKSKQDGVITKDEIKEAIDIVVDGIKLTEEQANRVKEEIEKIKKNKGEK